MRAEGFAAVPNWMIRDRSVPRNAILVYASLSSRAGLGAIYPSQATIAEESGLSERTVRTMLGHLEAVGVVQRERRNLPGSKRATDAYTLHPNGSANLAAGLAGRSDLAADLPASGGVSGGNEAHAAPPIEVDNQEVERGPRDRGSRIPDPFVVTSEMWAWAAEKAPLVDARRATEMFVNYWRSKTGRDATKREWVRTWQNWLLKDQADAERHAPRARTFAQQKQDGNLAILARYQDEGMRDEEIRGGSAAGVRALAAGS